MHPDSFYRVRLFKDFVRIVVVPWATLFALLRTTEVRLGLLAVPAHVVFIVFWAYTRLQYADWMHRRDARRMGARPIPRVRGRWPGNLDIYLQLLKAYHTTYLGSFHLKLFEEYHTTTLNLRLLWQDFIITMDAKHQQFVLATGYEHFWRGVGQKERMEEFLGAGIFNRDDQEWKAHRALARPFFSRDRVTDFELFERYADRTVSLMSSRCELGEPVEVQDMYARFTLDAASEFLFGKNVDTLSGRLPEPGNTQMSGKGSATGDEFGSFAQSFEDAQVLVLLRVRRGYFWPIYELFTGDPHRKHMAVIEKWLEPLIQDALQNKSDMQKSGLKNPLDQSVFLQYLVDNTEDPKVMQDQLLNILLASRDTTSSLLTYVTYFLASHPDVTKRLRAEILEHCGVDSAPTFDDIKNMKYMRAVINETLRLFPPVAVNSRESKPHPSILPNSDGTYLQPAEPLYMPPLTPIAYFTSLMHRNSALWGPDADVFDPDRWLDKRLSKFVSNPMMFTPFSAGPRICIGQNYALNEASLFLTRLLQRFDTFTLAPEAQPAGSLPPSEWKQGKGRETFEKLWPNSALTSYVKGGLWVRLGRVET
ncbi:cytochrome P450 [Fomitopsis serialis]|uniref:cytochrome P450 n=1 Tax=Fomitopsis serialis TaxID=139415 RepID=UPI002007893F|nr:cytochrome P450 [Neoantrodia serialis]KAH9927640.1 cytochrome P450 [Neoantrodia serialis]